MAQAKAELRWYKGSILLAWQFELSLQNIACLSQAVDENCLCLRHMWSGLYTLLLLVLFPVIYLSLDIWEDNISPCSDERNGIPGQRWCLETSLEEGVWTLARPWTGSSGCVLVLQSQVWRLKVRGARREDLQDGGGVRRGDHLPPHKYIRNTSTRGTTPTEPLLNAGRRRQTSQKARKSPRTWVG